MTPPRATSAGDAVRVEAGDDVGAIVVAFAAQLPDAAGALSLLARFAVGEADRDTVTSAFRSARALTLDEPGCQVFELSEEAQHLGRFLVYERWRSLTDLDSHLRRRHTADLRALFHRLIVDGPEFQVLLPAV